MKISVTLAQTVQNPCSKSVQILKKETDNHVKLNLKVTSQRESFRLRQDKYK